MRLKYKKMLLLLTMGVMGIGMLSISFDKTSSKDAIEADSNQVLASNDEISKGAITITNAPTIEATNTPTPIPEDPTKLKLSNNPEIQELIETFYDALIHTDEETLSLITTPYSTYDITVINKKYEYIYDIHNIICYTKPGIKEGDYVVYLTFDMEIASIDTYGPSAEYQYVTTIDDQLYVRYGDYDEEIKKLLMEYNTSQDVIDLVVDTDKALQAACASDEALKEFYDNLILAITSSKQNTSSSEDEKAESNQEENESTDSN